MPTTFESLPPGVLYEIIGATERKSVICMAQTSRTMYRTLIPKLYQRICYYPVSPQQWKYQNDRITNKKLIFQTEEQWHQIMHALERNAWLQPLVEEIDVRYAPAQWVVVPPQYHKIIAGCINMRRVWLPPSIRVAEVASRWTRLENADTDNFVGWDHVSKLRELIVGNLAVVLGRELAANVETLELDVSNLDVIDLIGTLEFKRLRVLKVTLRPHRGLKRLVGVVNRLLAATVTTLMVVLDDIHDDIHDDVGHGHVHHSDVHDDAYTDVHHALLALYCEAKLIRARRSMHEGLQAVSIIAKNASPPKSDDDVNATVIMTIAAILLTIDWSITKVWIHLENFNDIGPLAELVQVGAARITVGVTTPRVLAETNCTRTGLLEIDLLHYAYLSTATEVATDTDIGSRSGINGADCDNNDAMKIGGRRGAASNAILVPQVVLLYPPWECPFYDDQVNQQ